MRVVVQRFMWKEENTQVFGELLHCGKTTQLQQNKNLLTVLLLMSYIWISSAPSSNMSVSLQKASFETTMAEIQGRYGMQMNGYQQQVNSCPRSIIKWLRPLRHRHWLWVYLSRWACWRSSWCSWMLTWTDSPRSTRRCWTSRPDWRWRSPSTGGCWTERDSGERTFSPTWPKLILKRSSRGRLLW